MLITQNTETATDVTLSQSGANVTIVAGVTYSYVGQSYAFRLFPPSNGNPVSFHLDGALFSNSYGISMTGRDADLFVSQRGYLWADFTAVVTSGTVSNAGIIGGDIGIAIADDTQLVIYNSGQIAGYTTAILGGNRQDQVTNAGDGQITGTIFLAGGSDVVNNSGMIQGAVTFNSLFGELPFLTNVGTIVGNVTGAAGSETITNSGRITGDVSTGAGADRIVNSGDITGSIVTSGLLGSARANVLNTGHITGSITTGAAADTIDTHLGTIGGGLFGGKGADTYVIAGTEQIGEVGSANGGFDTVLSYGDYRLGIGLEALSLFGDARLGIGNELANYLTANELGSTLIGGAGDDFLFGERGDDTLRGGVGNDTIYEADGQNTIYGGAGDDKVYLAAGDSLAYGGNGQDLLSATSGDNLLNGGNGSDMLVSGDGADYLIGDLGVDTASYANSTSGIVVSLDLGTASGGYADGDMVSGVENLIGSAFVDQLTGTIGANRLDGGGGADTLIGGDGDDVLTGGAAGDVVNGGAGFDTADYSTATVAIVLNGGTISGDIVGDSFNAVEGFQLSNFDDTFVAVYDLSLTIGGGAGNDRIVGKGAADRLDGDTGDDTLTGGGGADVFQFDRFFNFVTTIGWGDDSITDFQDGTDKIDLSHAFGIDAFSDLTVTGGRTGTTISFGSDSILLTNVASANVTAADFIFG